MLPDNYGGSSDKLTNSTVEGTMAPVGNVAVKLVVTDFNIDKSGKAKAMIFSEADYKKAKRTKIKVTIQRRKNGKWVRYKKYKTTNNSNVAFMSEEFSVKKKGKYRMSVKVVFYGDKKERNKYKVKSKVQKYQGG